VQPILLFLWAEKDYEVSRNNVTLGAIIGEGQFGDVHRGTIKSKVFKHNAELVQFMCRSS
jgi:hypothetical protein